MKYHPEDSGKRKAELKANLQNRVEAFNKLLSLGLIDSTKLDVDSIETIMKVLDSGMLLGASCNKSLLNSFL